MNLKKLQDTIENLQTFDSSFFIGQSYFLPKNLLLLSLLIIVFLHQLNDTVIQTFV